MHASGFTARYRGCLPSVEDCGLGRIGRCLGPARAGPKYAVGKRVTPQRWSRSIARSVLPIPEGFGIERARGRRDEPKDG